MYRPCIDHVLTMTYALITYTHTYHNSGKHAAQIMQELEMSTYPMHGMDSAPPQLTTPPQPATSGTSMQRYAMVYTSSS